jgi:hypothetical protein
MLPTTSYAISHLASISWTNCQHFFNYLGTFLKYAEFLFSLCKQQRVKMRSEMNGLKECKWFFVFKVVTNKIYEFDGCRIYMKNTSRNKLSESAKHTPHNHKFIFTKSNKLYVGYEIIKKARRKIFRFSWYAAISFAFYSAGENYYLPHCCNYHAFSVYDVVYITLYVNRSLVLGMLFFYLLAIIRFYVAAVLCSTNVAGWGGDMCLAHLVTGRADNATIYVHSARFAVFILQRLGGTTLLHSHSIPHEGNLGSWGGGFILYNEWKD